MEEKISSFVWKDVEGVKALYLAGSRAVGCETSRSDWDFFGITDELYDYERESDLNDQLSSRFEADVRFRAICHAALLGGSPKGVLCKYIPLRVLLRSFPEWKHLRGESFRLDDFSIEVASDQDAVRFHKGRLKQYFEKARTDALPFPFADYVKSIFLWIGARQALRGHEMTMSYVDIAVRADEQEKLARLCLQYREGSDVPKSELLEALQDTLGW